MYLREFVGQERLIRELIAVTTMSDHWNVLLRGYYGYGKTLLATLLAAVLVSLSSYQIPSGGKINISPRYGIHIVDECHLTRHLELLYEPMKSHNFIFCTNTSARLPEAFISRCFTFRMEGYSVEELADIVSYHAWDSGSPVSDEVAGFIGRRCRGNPRTGVMLMQKYVALYTKRNLETVTDAFSEFGIDDKGLNRLDRQVLKYLAGGTKSKRTLAIRLGIDLGEYERLESYLIRQGLVEIGPNGRRLA